MREDDAVENRGESEKEKSPVERTAEHLFAFAIDREDVKWLMARLPEDAAVKRTAVEYELPILKIIGVGWSINYFLPDGPRRSELTEAFWRAIAEFSRGLSETTGLMIGREIDYFEILKQRLDTYVKALEAHPEAKEPVAIIGPEFARLCGNAEDVFAIMTANRMFVATVGAVKEYLESIKLR